MKYRGTIAAWRSRFLETVFVRYVRYDGVWLKPTTSKNGAPLPTDVRVPNDARPPMDADPPTDACSPTDARLPRSP
jgi:hypothetical protein